MTARRPLFSVIVPVHNGAATLERALASVTSQPGDNWELVVVDDGSQDATPEILRRYSSDRVRTASTPNGGVSRARNLGMSLSTGEYLLFLDADDEFLPGALPHLTEAARSVPDAICFGMRADSGRDLVLPESSDRARLLRSILSPRGVGGFACNKAFRRSVVAAADLTFDPELRFMEDLDFTVRFFLAAESCHVLHRPLYLYHDGQGVSAARFSPQRFGARHVLGHLADRVRSDFPGEADLLVTLHAHALTALLLHAMEAKAGPAQVAAIQASLAAVDRHRIRSLRIRAASVVALRAPTLLHQVWRRARALARSG